MPDGTANDGQPWAPPPPPTPYPRYAPQPGYDPVKDLAGNIKALIWSAGFTTFLAVLILNLIIVLAMTPEIQHWITSAPHPHEYIFIITPQPRLLFHIEGAEFQAWHFLMLGILVAAFARAKYDLLKSWMSGKGRALLSLTVPRKAESSLEAVGKLFMASMFFSTLYFVFLALINVEMQTPAFDELSRPELIYGLFTASVFEELISRVLLVGVPLVIIGLLMNREKPFSKLLGGGTDLTRTTAVLIVFSAVMFAFAHVGSWDFWKVPQVLVTGLALGWAFVRYGLHASILIHFSINLSTSAMEIWPGNMAVDMLLSVIIMLWLVAGGYFFLHYVLALARRIGAPIPKPPMLHRRRPNSALRSARREMRGSMRTARRVLGIRRRYRRRTPHERRRAILPPPPPDWQNHHATVPPPPWAEAAARTAPPARAQRSLPADGFVCPNCGSTDASYDSGKFRCLRCGTMHTREGQAEKNETGNQIDL